jgi:hypothetical protein
MPVSETKFINRCAQWIPKSHLGQIPHATRGVYALLHYRPRVKKYDVVYIGMAPRGGILSRLRAHAKSDTKIWSHFSIFRVWENITEDEVSELEGLFREIYRKDKKANRFNKQKKYKKLQNVRDDNLKDWPKTETGTKLIRRQRKRQL